MHFKNILNNTFYFALLSSFALTEAKRNDCEEVKDYVSKNVENYAEVSHYYDEKVIDSCGVNENGEMSGLYVYNFMLKEEEVDRILDYDTINELYYALMHNEYTQDYDVFPPRISKLTNLEILHIVDVDIPEGFAKGSSSTLKDLTIQGTKIQQQTIDDISTLANLERLHLNKCSINNKLRLKPLNKLKNFKSLSLTGSYENEITITQNLINDISTITNLEELSFEYCIFKDTIDYSPLKKLTKLKNLFFDGELNPKAKIQLPSNLKTAYIQFLSVSQNLIDALTTTALEELVFFGWLKF